MRKQTKDEQQRKTNDKKIIKQKRKTNKKNALKAFSKNDGLSEKRFNFFEAELIIKLDSSLICRVNRQMQAFYAVGF